MHSKLMSNRARRGQPGLLSETKAEILARLKTGISQQKLAREREELMSLAPYKKTLREELRNTFVYQLLTGWGEELYQAFNDRPEGI